MVAYCREYGIVGGVDLCGTCVTAVEVVGIGRNRALWEREGSVG